MRGRKLITALAVLICAAGGGFMTNGSAGAVSSADDVRADIFQLINAATDGCADLSPTSNEVVQEPCTGPPTQVWLAQPLQTEPYEQLINQSSGLCMDLAHAVGDSTPVVLRPCSHKLISQQWQGVFGLAPGFPVKAVNRALGQCLEVKDGSMTNGAPLQVSPCVDSVEHQTWFKIPPDVSRATHVPAAASASVTRPASPGDRNVRRTPDVVPAELILSPGCFSSSLPIDCRIDEPIVNEPQVTYPLTFLVGDHVTVDAGGCVQTGGKGKTWKRYVDPISDNANLYHGLITIPGVTRPLIRLSNIVNRTFVVGGRGGGLVLGYEDDGYSDNGYYAHDDGTANQCLNSVNAFVHIFIS
jgi:hypothetical protein